MQHLSSSAMYRILIVQFVVLVASAATSLRLPETVRRPPTITYQSAEFLYALPEAKIVLHCKADALPNVRESGIYYWKKDGEYFNISQRHEGNDSLQIFMPSVNGSIYFNGSESLGYNKLLPYGGKYQCFAKNEWGTAMSSEIDLKIASKSPPYSFPADETLKVNEGDPLELTCHKNAAEDVEIEWEFDPKTVQTTEKIAMTSDGSIVFSNVEKGDNGIIVYCSLKYLPTRSSIDGTHYTIAVNSEVIAPDGPPEIIRPKEKGERRIALRGEETRLNCVATGKPTPLVNWTRNGEVPRSDEDEDEERFRMIDFGRTLLITNVQYGDAGTYTWYFDYYYGHLPTAVVQCCTAKSDMGLRRRDIELVVEAKPYFADNTKRPTNKIAEPGDSVNIRCEPEGKPEPEVVWLKNGEPVDVTDGGIVGGNRISLRDLTESDTGVYQCIGKNVHGTIMGQGFLNVLTSPPIPQSDNKLAYRKLEETSVDMKCEMFGAPGPAISWKKFKQPQRNLLDDRRITMRDEKALKVVDINLDDSGVYECMGTNEYGSSSINVTLTVLEKTFVRPIFQKEVYNARKGSAVAMAVKVFSDPKMVIKKTEWFKDGHSMGTGLELNLLSVSSADEGTYIIVVTTELDSDQATIELIVQDVPNIPSKPIFTVDEEDPYSGTLNWERPNDNNSPISSYVIEKQASGMFPGQWEDSLTSPGVGNPQSRLSDLDPWVTYRFRVWAENEIGRSRNASFSTEPYRTPPAAPRINPTGVTGNGTYPDNMVITWDPVDSTKFAGKGFGYEVSWCIETGCAWNESKDTFCEFNETSFIVTGTPPYTRYLIKVRSANNEGRGPDPEVVVGYSGEDIPLESPSDVKHQVGNDSKVRVSWKPVPGEKIRGLPTGYLIKARDTKSGKVINTTAGPDETSVELQLEPYTEYEITVAVTNNAGASDPSDTIEVKTPEGIPDAPANFFVTKRTLNELKLKWEEPAQVKGIITQYRLRYIWTEGSETKSAEKLTMQRNLKLLNLNADTTYNLTLCAKTVRGFGDDCAQLTASTLAPRKPRGPTFEAEPDESRVNITWQISEDDTDDGIPIRSYRIEHKFSEKENKEWAIAGTIKADSGDWAFNFTVNDLAPGTMYEFRLVAINEYGEAISNSTARKTAGTQYRKADSGIVSKLWLIILLCIAAVAILIIVIVCFMKKRKGGKYAVKEKEEQLRTLESQPMNSKDNGKYTSANEEAKDTNGPLVQTDGPDRPLRLRGDSVGGNSIEAFGSGDTRAYEEDGSFIEQYGVDRRSYSKSDGVSSPISDDSKDVSNAQTILLSDSDRAH